MEFALRREQTSFIHIQLRHQSLNQHLRPLNMSLNHPKLAINLDKLLQMLIDKLDNLLDSLRLHLLQLLHLSV